MYTGYAYVGIINYKDSVSVYCSVETLRIGSDVRELSGISRIMKGGENIRFVFFFKLNHIHK